MDGAKLKQISVEELDKEYVFQQLVQEEKRDVEMLTINVKRNNAVDGIIDKTCYQCNSLQPPYVYHCHTCKRCVAYLDHHCPWINNCVGLKNHNYFLGYIVSQWLLLIYVMVLIIWAIVETYKWTEDPQLKEDKL